MSGDTIRVAWRRGQQADVSRELYAWIGGQVPEAATPEARADIYELGVKLVLMLRAVGDATADTSQMQVAQRNAASEAVVGAWDALMTALARHPSYRADHHAACERHDVAPESASRYTAALQEVIDGYREPQRLPKGGRAPRLKMHFLVDHADQVRRILGASELRSAVIVCGIVQLAGGKADAQTLRQTMRNRRV